MLSLKQGGHFLLKYFAQLKLNESILSRNMPNLSDGEKTKIHLAALKYLHPDILLLDEPTNQLDCTNLKWLGSFFLVLKESF
jgi:ATPase subunit of ABC transporter with duplicated ATPase domains